jgi:Mn-dependent DtxR family transcriptional regulator
MTEKIVAVKKSSVSKHKSSAGGSAGASNKILNCAVVHKSKTGKNLEVKMITLMTGIQGKSTIRNALAKLKKLNWIDTDVKDGIVVTEVGLENADPNAFDMNNAVTTNKEHLDNIKEHFKLNEKAIAAIDFISSGRVFTKDEVANALGMQKNSTLRNLFADMKNKGIIEYHGKSSLQLTKEMFPFDPRPE